MKRLRSRKSRIKNSLLSIKISIAILFVFFRKLLQVKFFAHRKKAYCLISRLFRYLVDILAFFHSLTGQYRGSNKLSFWLRPIFEYRKAQNAIGIGIILALIIFGISSVILPVKTDRVFAGFVSSSELNEQGTITVKPTTAVVISTESKYQIPVELIGISQEFNTYHNGVDMRSAFGSNVHPIADGVVIDVLRTGWGYGQALIIDHDEEVSSLYAHLKNIYVDVGAHVDQNTVIAQVGLTGTTTGPHLHLEIHQNGIAVNPQIFLGY
jgi:murein DD-endopeptidase MepM/ murein hydrolase activator NlpD